MKTKVFLLVCLTMMMVSCGGNSSSAEEETAKLRDRIAALEEQLAAEKQANTTTYSGRTSRSQQRTVEAIAGVYTVTDKINNTWTLTLNEDGSGNMRQDEAVAYCSWKDYRNIDYGITISFSQRSPKLWFPIGEESPMSFCMADGYLYANDNAYKAKNPELRLPMKKVK